jgi:hypothetical protein
MIAKTPNFKIILKRTLYTFLIILLFLITWITFAIYHDESPDIGRDEFYALNPNNIPDNQNIAVALSGLNAPIGVDIIKHGRFVIDTFYKTEKSDEAKKTIDAAGKLAFVGNSNEFDCWLDYPAEKSQENCASAERVKFLMVENKVLLNRYTSLFQMPDWRGMSANGQLLINLNKLLAAEIKLDIETGHDEMAYSKWLASHSFITHVLKQDGTAIDRAIFLVLDGINLYSIENLLFKSPNIGINHFDELEIILKPTSLERYNLKGMLRAEYHFINTEFFNKHNQKLIQTHMQKDYSFHPEFIRNRLYRAHIDFFNVAQKSPAKFRTSMDELYRKHGGTTTSVLDYYWLDPINSVLSKMLTGGFIKSLELIRSMHAKNALISLLNLSLQIKQEKIPPANIQAFLNRAGKQYNCPFTNQPMQFDAQKNILFCENPESKSRVANLRL